MTFMQDNQISNIDDSRLRPPPFGNFLPGFPNTLPGTQTPPTPGKSMNLGAPPNYTPSKSSPEVQSLQSSGSSGKTKAVSPNSIRFCLFKFTYIWETNGNNYWAFIFDVDRKTVTGLRWFRGRWVYFGVDIRRIDSFVCYREALPVINSSFPDNNFFNDTFSDNSNPNNNFSPAVGSIINNDFYEGGNFNSTKDLSGLGAFPCGDPTCIGYPVNKSSNKKTNDCNCKKKKRGHSSLISKTEYTTRGINETFYRVLSSVNIPEVKEDFVVNYLGENEDNIDDFKAAFPCKQARIINYRIVLEITYPSKFNKELIEDLNKAAYDSSLGAESTLNQRSTQDFLSTLDMFEEVSKNIPSSLNVFTSEFNNKIKYLKLSKDVLRNIEYKLIKETIEDDWHVI
ncbi:hypothetical protein [Clostridium sp.]|uniref:hypothetical protein n=1 Tax=Clostridium sp. TaxID=1506 RepID=UPI002607FAAE|nr:hypothetical protein [Clostridium sp.]